MNTNAEVVAQHRFRWGIILAWVPLAFFIVSGSIELVGAIQSQKATGLGAVAGGLSEAMVTFGFVAIVASEIAGIVMLLRTFSRKHPMRGVIAVVSMCSSALLLLVLGFFLWFTLTHNWR